MERALKLARRFGYLYEEEVEFLAELVRGLEGPEPIVVNVGAGAGTSALTMREARMGIQLYTIDISPGGPLGGLSGERDAFKEFGLPIPNQILADSGSAAEYWRRNKYPQIDMIFIDDGHGEPDVRRDITKWLPLVRDGGIMAFHDYDGEAWPAVKLVVDELMKKHTQIRVIRTIAAYQIKKERRGGPRKIGQGTLW